VVDKSFEEPDDIDVKMINQKTGEIIQVSKKIDVTALMQKKNDMLLDEENFRNELKKNIRNDKVMSEAYREHIVQK
jgi:hypothetical protein